MKSYKLYIFDFDDTLVLTVQDVLRFHYPQVAQQLKIDYLGDEVTKKNWGGKLADSLGAVFRGNASPAHIQSTLHKIYEERPITPAEGAASILSTLKKHNKFVCIATSGHARFVETSIRNSLGMDPGDFDHALYINGDDTKKPSPLIVSSIRQEYETQRNTTIEDKDIVYIGDSLLDYFTARNYGVDFAAVTTGVHSRDDFLKAGLSEHCIFNSLRETVVPPESHGIVALIQNSKGEYLLLQEGRRDNPYYGSWSGPHGRCMPEDILEEETVVRETYEECGLLVQPVEKVYQRAADTKIQTVGFWTAKASEDPLHAYRADQIEVAGLQWAALEEIRAGRFRLYPGTEDYFLRHQSQTKNDR